jgi:PPM family protein phosphatase
MSASQAVAMETGEIRIDVFGRTDVGRIREHNEDNFLVADLTRGTRTLRESDRLQAVGAHGTLLGVCDGMGGAAAGEVASQFAVDTVFKELTQGDAPADHDQLAFRLVKAVEHAGLRIYSESRVNRSRMGMGTTATVAAVLDRRLFVAQVGDSRCYVLRDGELTQVSRDQSLVNQLIEAGQLTEEEAETFEHNNIILQALGTADSVSVDLTYVDLCAGDVVLLCSDGLSGMIRADEIREVLVDLPDPKDACRELTERANHAGGHDNVTVVVAKFSGEGLPQPGPDEAPPGYDKYTLTATEDPTWRPEHTPEPPQGEISDEAQRESRQLKVGHTMFGMQAPIALDEDGESRRSDSDSRPPSSDGLEVPVSGMSPALVGLMVIGLIVAAAIAGGYFALVK